MRRSHRPGPRRAKLLWLLRWALPLGLLVGALSLAQYTRELVAGNRSPLPIYPAPRFDARLVSATALSPVVALPEEGLPLQLILEPGETLGGIFADLGLPPDEAGEAVEALRQYVDPRKLKAGNTYAVYLDGASALSSFEMRMESKGRVRLSRATTGWEVTWKGFERTVETRVIEGQLRTSLEEAIRQGQGPALLAYEMSDVLQWDLDFTRDLRVGDRFEVIFDEVYLDGQYDGVGDVLALRYENRGRTFEAYQYGDSGSYYDAEGRPMQKMFLRSPLRFSRVTSGFSRRRFHPVLKTWRPHYGVDYGAPVGTPVRVTASGTVIFAGWDRGGGKTVKVRHPRGYITAYLHLSRFGEGMAVGKAVRQGDLIGYVGATGLATAPHLDYRVNLNGRWIDPLSIGSVPAKALSSSEMPAFIEWRDSLRARLDVGTPLDLPAENRDAGQVVASGTAGGSGVSAAGRR